MPASFRDRLDARRKRTRSLCERLGRHLYLFRKSATEYQDRLIILAHGATSLATQPQTFSRKDGHDVEFLFITDFGHVGNGRTILSQAAGDNFSAAGPDGGDEITNYLLSKSLGWHAGEDDSLGPTYQQIQDGLASEVAEEEASFADRVLANPNGMVMEITGGQPPETKGEYRTMRNTLVSAAKDVKTMQNAAPHDILSVRNRAGNHSMTLKAAYDAVCDRHRYSQIVCGFCRVIYDATGERMKVTRNPAFVPTN